MYNISTNVLGGVYSIIIMVIVALRFVHRVLSSGLPPPPELSIALLL